MFRITLDTNILISATIVKGNEYDLLNLARLNKVKIVLSLSILKEFKEVISRERFGYPPKIVDDLLRQILNISEIVIPKKQIKVIKEDPDDDKILECALVGNVDYIVSGDKHLLNLKEYKGIKIVRTKEVLALLEKQNSY